MSTSPTTASTFATPRKETSNAHPYAIKSSSSAVLSRSNSISNSVAHHHYVPLPSAEKIQNPNRKRRYVPSKKLPKINVDVDGSPIDEKESVVIPAPISLRVKRRDTLPSSFPNTDKDKTESEDVLKNLPPNPKQWTPSQLATYLSSVLRLRGGAPVPSLVMNDITAFIVKQRLTGRVFLKMTRDDYNSLDINPLWKEALANANLTLRRNLLQGQVFGSIRASMIPAEDLSLLRENEEENTDNPVVTSPAVPGAYVPWDRKRTLGRLQSGRVKGIAHEYERSYSEGEADFSRDRRRSDFLEKSESDSDTSFADSPVSERSDFSEREAEIPELSFLEKQADQEEPTVEELIQSSTLWGAQAWEEENPHSTNVTAKKIPTSEESTEEILNKNVGKKGYFVPETLASLFPSPAPDMITHQSQLPEDNSNLEKAEKVSEDIPATTYPVPPSLESADDMPCTSSPEIPCLPSASNSSADISPGSLFTSFYSSNPSATTLESYNAAKRSKADASTMTEDEDAMESLRMALHTVQDRLMAVEKRLSDLENHQEYGRNNAADDRADESLTEVQVRPNPVPSESPTTPKTAKLYNRDIVDDDLNGRKPSKNYALSDLSVYSYMFYASIGLAVIVVDRAIFGRRRE